MEERLRRARRSADLSINGDSKSKKKKNYQSVEKTLFQLDYNKNYCLFVITLLVYYVVFLKAYSVKRLY